MHRSDLASLVGQSLMFRFQGPRLSDQDRDDFRRMRPSGVLHFADNLKSREQITALNAELQALAREEGMPPLFIAADQEGGIVTRFPADMVTVPSAMALGDMDEADIRESARITARQLRDAGFNTNYAPTLDVNINPDNPVIRTRSFGESPEIVARGGVATIEGYLAEGIIPTAKHFPGHGDTSVDSHHGLPVIEGDLARLHAIELAPFKAAIAAGLPSIMTAHIVFPALDEHPATLSKRILTGLLRDELEFTGVIHTDSMSMSAIADRYGLGPAAVQAKAAGADVLESSEPPAPMLERLDALIKAVEDGSLPISVFEDTAARLDRVRHQFSIGTPPESRDADDTMMDRAVALARRSLRTARGAAVPTLPNDPSTVIVAFERLRNLEVVDRLELPRAMADACAEQIPNATVLSLSSDLREDEIAAAEQAVAHAATVVIMTRDANEHRSQIPVAERLLATAPDATARYHVCVRGPYDRDILGSMTDTIFTFGDPVVSLRALVNAFAGH